ncbi:hypothetical protein JZU48_04585, partial [bacterium]|nr:hypothetical protein [bacterium]
GFPQGGEVGPTHAAAYSEWGVSLAALRQIPAAVQSFEYAVQTAPDYADAYVKWVLVLRAAGDTEAEAAVLKRLETVLSASDPSRSSLYPEYLVGRIGNDAHLLATGGRRQP